LTLCSALTQAIRDDVSGVRESVLGVIDRVDQLQINSEGKTSFLSVCFCPLPFHVYFGKRKLNPPKTVSKNQKSTHQFRPKATENY
jgi:hypothetical protein